MVRKFWVTSAVALTLTCSAMAEYSETTAKYYVDFTGAAYCGGNWLSQVENWSCHVCDEHPGVDATRMYDDWTDANGFVAYVPERNQVMVVFAGTDPTEIGNWVSNINTIMKDYPQCPGCKIHNGFYVAYGAVEDQMLDLVATYTASHPTADVTVTGHSLGGAMASHAVVKLVQMGYNVKECYTFGMPRVGNRAWEEHYTSMGVETYRVTHHRDPVPHLPFYAWGFRHVSTEVFYKDAALIGSSLAKKEYHSTLHPSTHTASLLRGNAGHLPTAEYGFHHPSKEVAHPDWFWDDPPAGRVCDGSGEDRSCAWQYYAFDVFDHLSYVGFDYTENWIKCTTGLNRRLEDEEGGEE